MARQVRISDDVAQRLEEQGGSLSQAAERTLAWALDLIDNAPDEAFGDAQPVDPPVDEPVDGYRPPPAGKPRVGLRISAGRRFAVQHRRPW